MNPTDTQGTGNSGAHDAQDISDTETPGADETHTDSAADAASDGADAAAPDADATDPAGGDKPAQAVPFANGKEKFVVNGKEFEWDWATTKKYAQLGRSGQIAQQKAAETEQKSRKFFGQLVDGAKKDPRGLIRTLLGDPNWDFSATPTRKGGTAAKDGRSADGGDESDPREAKIQELEAKISRLEQGDEERQLEQERKAFHQEFEDAIKSYPNLDDEVTREYVKSEYRKALMNGLEVSVDDVAFTVSEKLKERQAQKDQEKKKRLQTNRERAPVTGKTGGDSGGSKPMSREDVLRLAGRIP